MLMAALKSRFYCFRPCFCVFYAYVKVAIHVPTLIFIFLGNSLGMPFAAVKLEGSQLFPCVHDIVAFERRRVGLEHILHRPLYALYEDRRVPGYHLPFSRLVPYLTVTRFF